MNLWQKFELKRNTAVTSGGIYFHYQKGIEPDLKQKYISFAKWLRANYIFPVRLNVYILNCEQVSATASGGTVSSLSWTPGARAPQTKGASSAEYSYSIGH